MRFLLLVTVVGVGSASSPIPDLSTCVNSTCKHNQYIAAASVPRIYLKTWSQEHIVQQIARVADTGPGFFYLMEHGIEQSVFDEAVQEAHHFFSLPSCDKHSITGKNYGGSIEGRDTWSKGYAEPQSAGAYEKDMATDARPEYEKPTLKLNTRESLVFRYPEESQVRNEAYMSSYSEFHRNQSEGVRRFTKNRLHEVENATRMFFAPNQWPESRQLSRFKYVVQRYFSNMKHVAQRMFALLSHAASSVNEPFPAGVKQNNGMHTFNLVHYPPSVNTSESEFGIADHTDWELFTLLYPTYLDSRGITALDGTTFTGLEVFYNGSWVAVPHVHGAIIVNQGEMLSRLTRGRFKPPVHRVQAQNPRERYSLASFWAPNFESLLPDPASGSVLTGEYYLKRNNFLK